MRERSSRRPVNLGIVSGGGPPETADTAAHPTNEKAFRDWLGGSKGQRSSISFSTPYTFERKAATPLLNAGGAVNYPAIYGPPPLALRLLQLMPNIPLSAGASVEYGQETSFTPAADAVAEGALKPGTVIAYDSATATVKTIATWTKASLQSLADVPGLRMWLDRRVRYAVMLKAESLFMADLLAAAGALSVDYTPTGTDVNAQRIGEPTGDPFGTRFSVRELLDCGGVVWKHHPRCTDYR